MFHEIKSVRIKSDIILWLLQFNGLSLNKHLPWQRLLKNAGKEAETFTAAFEQEHWKSFYFKNHMILLMCKQDLMLVVVKMIWMIW